MFYGFLKRIERLFQRVILRIPFYKYSLLFTQSRCNFRLKLCWQSFPNLLPLSALKFVLVKALYSNLLFLWNKTYYGNLPVRWSARASYSGRPVIICDQANFLRSARRIYVFCSHTSWNIWFVYIKSFATVIFSLAINANQPSGQVTSYKWH